MTTYKLCAKGLHPMTPENTQSYLRMAKGGGHRYMATRCAACKGDRQKKPLCYEQKLEQRQADLAVMFDPFKTDGSWQERSGCIGEDPDTMSPDLPHNSHEAKRTIERNCSWCPVRQECLVDALATPTHGIRGGMLLPGALLKWDHVPLLETLTKQRDGVDA